MCGFLCGLFFPSPSLGNTQIKVDGKLCNFPDVKVFFCMTCHYFQSISLSGDGREREEMGREREWEGGDEEGEGVGVRRWE